MSHHANANTPSEQRLARVVDHFSAETDYWDVVYRGQDVASVIYRERLALALRWVDRLKLGDDTHAARALDLGTGAGQAAIALARLGFAVDAIDASRPMAKLARDNAARAGVASRVRTAAGDAQALAFPNETFDVVLALGVLPWVQAPSTALAEIARVLRPHGFAVVSTANRARLTYRLDPLRNQDIQPIKRPLRAFLERRGRWPAMPPEPRLDSLRATDHLLAEARLQRVADASFGFGPFTLLGRRVFGERTDVWLHRRLQRLAERGIRGLTGGGTEYLVLVRRLG